MTRSWSGGGTARLRQLAAELPATAVEVVTTDLATDAGIDAPADRCAHQTAEPPGK
jgi:hypothetical protein